MKIGLLGFVAQDANKGCEALTYSFLHLVRKYVSEPVGVHFFVPSVPLNQLQKDFPEFEFTIGKIKLKDPKLKFISLIRSCDLVYDVTCGDGFSDIYFPKNVFFTTLFKIVVEMCGVPLYLLPQTYGPFKSRKLEQMAKFAIRRSKKVYARDKKSVDYVKKMANVSAINTTDLAFALPYHDGFCIDHSKINVGINVSGLLWNGGFTEENQFGLTVDYRQYIITLVNRLKMNNNYSVHLIPHVIENENDHIDGDVKICQLLAKEHDVLCAPAFATPIDAKSYISKMDAFVGARMHSTIAAFSAKVPVIPFSYSRKFEGLYENLNYPYLIHGCNDTTEEALDITFKWILQREDLKNNIEVSMKQINNYLSIFEAELENSILCTKGKH